MSILMHFMSKYDYKWHNDTCCLIYKSSINIKEICTLYIHGRYFIQLFHYKYNFIHKMPHNYHKTWQTFCIAIVRNKQHILHVRISVHKKSSNSFSKFLNWINNIINVQYSTLCFIQCFGHHIELWIILQFSKLNTKGIKCCIFLWKSKK